MKKAIKGVFLMGLGAARITREKAESTIGVFVKKKVVSARDGNEIVKLVLAKSKKLQTKLKREGIKEFAAMKKKSVSTTRAAKSKLKKSISKAVEKSLKR